MPWFRADAEYLGNILAIAAVTSLSVTPPGLFSRDTCLGIAAHCIAPPNQLSAKKKTTCWEVMRIFEQP